MVNGSCKNETLEMTSVYTQRGERWCMAYAMSDMATITLVMSGNAPNGTKLSSQGLIDYSEVTNNVEGAIHFCTSDERGLDLESDYQHTGISREIPVENVQEIFQTPSNERFRLQNMELYRSLGNLGAQLNKLKPLLCNMFVGGPRYPCVVGIRTYRFKDKNLAKEVALRTYVDPETGVRGALYRPSKEDKIKYRKPNLHALLVVGVNTDHEDPAMHYCEVKNSHGFEWGDEGFSLIPYNF